MTRLITVLGALVAFVMAIGAILARSTRCIPPCPNAGAKLPPCARSASAGRASCSHSLIEAVLIALIGGVIGCIAVLPLNGLTTGTMNWQTFSHLGVSRFEVRPAAAVGIGFRAG